MIPSVITPQLKAFICDGFSLIRGSSNYDYLEKANLMASLFSMGAGAGWRPKQITHEAVKLFIANDFKVPKGLERAHWPHSRRETMKILIENNWDGDEWWDWFKDRDYTVLATRAENRDENTFEELPKIEIPLALNLFRGKRVGFVYGDSEKRFLKDLEISKGFLWPS